MTIDPATALAFSMQENKGVYANLLGSGVSHAAQVPTGWADHSGSGAPGGRTRGRRRPA